MGKVLACELGSTHLRFGLVDEEHTIINRTERFIRTEDLEGPLKMFLDEAARLAARYEPDAIGVSSHGNVDRHSDDVHLGASNIFDPEIIVVGGGLMESPDLFLPTMRNVFKRSVLPGAEDPPIEFAGFGKDAGLIGAAIATEL